LQRRLVGASPKEQSPSGESQSLGQKGKIGNNESESAEKLEAAVADQPAIVVGRYGRGRTLAMAVPITSPWANEFLTKWGGGDSRYYAKFWRNAIYWLTENSSIGRRRLVASADKKFYRPGETISISAAAFDESATQTGAYRVISMVEPQAALNDLESDYAPLRWPDGKPRKSGETSPFLAWGEEFDLARSDDGDGSPAFALEIPIAEALAVGAASQSLRIELTAMDDYTQVDSTSLDIQILHDPFEQQNPFPNHELLASIAAISGGRVLQSPSELAEVMTHVPIQAGAPVVKKAPVWSTWAVWFWLLGLLTADWIYRRIVGLA
jgi:hypothetical protein